MSHSTLIFCLVLFSFLFARPVAAFGAGEVPQGHKLDGHFWRHGDFSQVLMQLPVSFITMVGFTEMQRRVVYFGNWLREYSQFLDVTCLTHAPENVLRGVVSALGFREFGLATGEFDVTRKRLGVYQHVQHIDNPKGYSDQARATDNRLRGPINPRELDIDPETGMKSYIAKRGQGWDTSADYIRLVYGAIAEQETVLDAIAKLGLFPRCFVRAPGSLCFSLHLLPATSYISAKT
ncbi:Het-C-domain-containing protein [Heliocybe sulcata]|uniref:Het-C-domain-containing protein n=1 Tax=Heliocybe sulcata TaxID=5364 RepID=A0A5C3MZM8_9AGAM|nr:Het-C-domain-containing protein [Heliocybe sulcata]